PDNVYIVWGPLHLDGATITIQPGTSVCFTFGPPGSDGRSEPPPGAIDVDSGGGIKALGTADKHVVFAQAGDLDQYWGGISFVYASNPANPPQSVDVYNAGLSAGGSPISGAAGETAKPLDLQHVTFYSVQRVGLKIYEGLTAASTVRFNNYAGETSLAD